MIPWAQAQSTFRRVTDSSIATAWKRWGRFAWHAPFAAIDISVSRDKTAAISANAADFGVAWALRNRRGALPFMLPLAAYAVTRAAVSLATGKHEVRGGATLGQKIASDIVTVGQSNSPVNPIKGHDAGHWGREQVFASGDFTPGSSWDGNKDNGPGLVATGLGAGVGIAAGLGITRNLWGHSGLEFDPKKYPRLARLREIGSKHGFKVVSKTIPGGFVYSELDIHKSFKGLQKYKGVVYNVGLPEGPGLIPPKNVINFGSWDIGVDKWKSHEYFAKRFPMAVPETLTSYDIFATQGEFDDAIRASYGRENKFIPHAARKHIWRNPTMKRLAKQWGGYGNIIVKDVWSAVQEGVWIGASTVPSKTLGDMLINPERFILQRKYPLAEEFRTITVGGKNVYATHRWGGKVPQKVLGLVEKTFPKLAESIKSSHTLENIFPVTHPETLKRLVGFSEGLAKSLPKGIDIAAFDIGMTTQGEFKLIEMQRMFGTIKHPIVNKRILEAITGRVPRLSKRIIAATAVVGALTLPALLSRNDPMNPIKGHDAGRWGRETTFASGDFEPGKSVRRFLGALPSLVKETRRVGAIAIKDLVRRAKGTITGTETLYHGTSMAAAEQVSKEGLRAKFTLQKGSPTRILLGHGMSEKSLKGLTYLTPSKIEAEGYAVLSSYLHAGVGFEAAMFSTRRLGVLRFGSPEYRAEWLKRAKSVFEFSIPVRSSTFRNIRRVNPEAKKSLFEYYKWQMEAMSGGIFGSPPKLLTFVQSYAARKMLLRHRVFAGNIGAEFITSGKIAPTLGRTPLRGNELDNWLSAQMKGVRIKAHDAGRWGREQTFAGGDFHPGWSWKGIFRTLRHPVKSVQAWRLGRRLAIGAKGYESMARYALNKQGIVSAGIETEIMTQVAKGAPVKGMIRLRAVGAEGETLISSMRAFGKEEIGLTDIVVSESMRGKGVGSFLRRGESAIFKTMGYREGTVVTSPVINPITARIHLQTYGGRLETAFPGAPANLEAQILAKNISKAQYEDLVGMATAVGRLPSNKALVKILGHDMRWGRSWVQRTLKTDFMPGASWIGTALTKGVSFEKIAQAAFKMGGPGVVAATTRSPKVFAKMLKTAHGAGGAEAVKKLIGSEFKVMTKEGGTYLRGAAIDKGGFKQAQMVYGVSPGTAERGVLAEAYAGGYGTDITRSADKVFGSLSHMVTSAEKFSAGVEGTITTVHKAYLEGRKAIKSAHPFAYEIKMQKEAREAFGATVPEILGVTKKGFIQEFAGVGLPKAYTTSSLKFAKSHIDQVALHGGVVPLHFDLHRANVLRRGAQLRLIDWGLAAKTTVTPKIAEHSKTAADIYFRGMTPGHTEALRAAEAAKATVAEKIRPSAIVNDQTAVAAKKMSTKRQERLNRLQQAAQPLPHKLNAQRRSSHGVDRSSRTK